MRRREFIDIILNGISEKFEIYHNYKFKDYKFVIYAYCYDYHKKYSQTPVEARLWEAKSYEHLFFINVDNLTLEKLNELKMMTIADLEPHFVRGDCKYPEKNHMYSYISFIIISRNKPSEDVVKEIQKTNWSKKYLMNARGYSSLRLVSVTPREYSVIYNKSAKGIADFLNNKMLRIE